MSDFTDAQIEAEEEKALSAAIEDEMRTRPLLLCDTHGALESNRHRTRCRIAAIRGLEDCRYITVWTTKRQDDVSRLAAKEPLGLTHDDGWVGPNW